MIWLALVALAAASAVGGFVVGRRTRQGGERASPAPLPTDIEHLVDLVRRAHRGLVATLARPGEPPATSTHPRGVDRAIVDRAEALARLALGDGRTHVLRDRAATIATCTGEVAAAFVFAAGDPSEDGVERVLADLSRLTAGITDAAIRERRRAPGRLQSHMAAHDSLDSALAAVCEAARELTDTPAAVVVRDPVSGVTQVQGVSQGTDRRLIGTSVAPDSAAVRAIATAVPIAGASAGELFGHFLPDRRRRREQGMAFPISDGKEPFAALIAFGRPTRLDEQRQQDLLALLADLGPHLAHLVQMRAAETRAMTDELTGLPNRRALHRAMANFDGERAALLCVDVDRFKLLNDRHGHVAGDAALKHLARVIRTRLREGDLAVRMGGEEFALWLPETPLDEACDVAERVRAAVAGSPCARPGGPIAMTCSVGVATVPDTTRAFANLYAAADAALYRAKEAGRNRVELARPDSAVRAVLGGQGRS